MISILIVVLVGLIVYVLWLIRHIGAMAQELESLLIQYRRTLTLLSGTKKPGIDRKPEDNERIH